MQGASGLDGSRLKSQGICWLMTAMLAGLLPGRVAAEGFHPSHGSPFSVSAGAAWFHVDAKMSKWTEGEEEEEVIDLDRLGVDNTDTSPYLTFDWRVSPRWVLAADYFRLDVSGGRRVDFDFEFGDLVVPIGAAVDSVLKLDFYVFSAAYSFQRSERAEFGFGLGVHGVDLTYELYADTRIGDATVILGEEDDNFLAPLPNLYIHGSYAFTPELVARIESGWLSLTYDDYDGDLLTLHGQLAYWWTDRFAIGAGYSFIDLDVVRDRGTRREHYDIYMNGPRAFVTYTF